MKVWADLRWPAGTGIGVVQRELLSRTPASVVVHALSISRAIGSPLSPLGIEQALSRQAGRDAVFWSPGFMPPCTRRVPAIVTVHDLIHLHFYSRWHALYYEHVLKRLYGKCAAIVCVSEFTRAEFLQWSGVDPSCVHVVSNGVDSLAFRQAVPLKIDAPYVLYSGNRRPYKNVDRLVAAYAASRLPREGLVLALTGEADPGITAQAKSLGVEGRIRFLGRLDDQGIKRAYRGATAVAFVSLYEGFGLPVLEAMASEVPVLASNASAVPEAAGGAALLVDPFSVEAISAGLDTIVLDQTLRSALVVSGARRAADATWDNAAHRLWSLVESIAISRA